MVRTVVISTVVTLTKFHQRQFAHYLFIIKLLMQFDIKGL